MTGTYDQAARALLSRPMLLARTDPALVCDWLHRSGPATADAVIRFVEEQASVHGKGWRAHRPDRLARRAVMVLIGHGLARHRPNGTVTARPAAARYQPSEPTIRGSRPAQETLS